MTAIERQLLAALIELEAAAHAPARAPTEGGGEATGKPDLRAMFERIERLERQLPAGAHPELRHYLGRKSYAKARLALAALADA
ncbi:MAG: hypothetical protein FJ387_00385 [Verrucomicrobia bacterium]|nr:hypothetical protein [Verrucomicrobiota bacterium]